MIGVNPARVGRIDFCSASNIPRIFVLHSTAIYYNFCTFNFTNIYDDALNIAFF